MSCTSGIPVMLSKNNAKVRRIFQESGDVAISLSEKNAGKFLKNPCPVQVFWGVE
jgi:hypothetical protein